MIRHLLRKRERFAYQPATALAQGIVESLDMIGLATLFPNCSMPFGWQDGGICFPKITVADGALAINSWKTRPQLACGRFRACTDSYTHDFACVSIDCQPNPFLATFFADK